MAEIDIPEPARAFFLTGVESIAEWEAVLLLRDSRDQPQDAASLARRLYITEAETLAILSRLVERGILRRSEQPVAFTFAPSSPELDEVISTCADLYRQYLIPVTRIIHSKPKMRLKAFADAFRIRKD
jgi:hypothetical protein